MHDTASNSYTATSHYSDPSSNQLFSPLSVSSRPQALKDSFGWFYPHDSHLEPSFENWQSATSDTTVQLNITRRPVQKPQVPDMPSLTNAESTDRGSVTNGSRRWRLNSNGQLVDAEAESSWELADDIGRLQIGDVTADQGDARVPIRTPPKSKIAAAAVTQITESSPLDSSSNTSVGSSPHVPDHQISHSRGSSADTTISSSRDSIAGNALLSHPPLKGAPPPEAKERPHSFSGGLSSADLRRLQQVGDPDHDRQAQQQQWPQNHNTEQLSYPTLSNQVHRPVPQQQAFNYPPNPQVLQQTDRDREDVQLDYNSQQPRNFGGPLPPPPHMNHGLVMNPMNGAAPPPPQFVQGRPNNPMNYRQTARNFVPQGPTPAGLGYGGGHHTSHLSLGNTQQLYEMMLPLENHHPAVTRVQQQHNVFRGTHHHSASDPAIRDVAALQMLNNNLQGFNPSMFQPAMPQPMPIYSNQFYNAQELAVQQVMAARLQSQYTGQYNVSAPTPSLEEVGSPTSSSGQAGPSANNRKLGLYKTELCRSWEEKGTCRYGAKCQFAHGEDELRRVSRHPKYKTEICKTFWVSGSCPYGKRCCFIHTELTPAPAAAGTAGASESTPPQPQADVRERSNSDPDTSSSVSLLTRISQRSQQQDSSANAAATPVDLNSSNGFQFTRPPTGSLRVDTSALDGASIKQNKSAYPSFASNGILLPAPEHISAKSPAPVTAGPDLGRHNLARMEIVGYPNHQKKNSTSSNSASNPRHSFSGTEADVSFSPSPPASGLNYGHTPTDSPQLGSSAPPRVNGHVRAGSAGNWGSISRSNLSTSTSAYPHGPSAAGEIMSNSPWSSTELALGSSRLHDKNWV